MAPTAREESTSSLKIPAWAIPALVGLALGGGSGTVLSRPVFGTDNAMTTTDVQAIVDKSIAANNEVLLQRIELIFARDKIRSAGLPASPFEAVPTR